MYTYSCLWLFRNSHTIRAFRTNKQSIKNSGILISKLVTHAFLIWSSCVSFYISFSFCLIQSSLFSCAFSPAFPLSYSSIAESTESDFFYSLSATLSRQDNGAFCSLSLSLSNTRAFFKIWTYTFLMKKKNKCKIQNELRKDEK